MYRKIAIFKPHSKAGFKSLALAAFHFQYENNKVYREYTDSLRLDLDKISALNQIPFLPVSLFRSHQVVCGNVEESEIIFSSTTIRADTPYKHFVRDKSLYETSFRKGFALFYGDIKKYCLLALLPPYSEPDHSALPYMVNTLIKDTQNPDSGVYTNNYEELAQRIKENEEKGQKTLLLGVTYTLLELAEKYPMTLKHTLIIETRGMKGRREELSKQEVHHILSKAFGIAYIHSKYGMTKLLSQAYSKGEGIYHCVPWMKVLVRDIHEPFKVGQVNETGGINIIDLANIHSCCFLATDDLGLVRTDDSFEISGRLDTSDIHDSHSMAASN